VQVSGFVRSLLRPSALKKVICKDVGDSSLPIAVVPISELVDIEIAPWPRARTWVGDEETASLRLEFRRIKVKQ